MSDSSIVVTEGGLAIPPQLDLETAEAVKKLAAVKGLKKKGKAAGPIAGGKGPKVVDGEKKKKSKNGSAGPSGIKKVNMKVVAQLVKKGAAKNSIPKAPQFKIGGVVAYTMSVANGGPSFIPVSIDKATKEVMPMCFHGEPCGQTKGGTIARKDGGTWEKESEFVCVSAKGACDFKMAVNTYRWLVCEMKTQKLRRFPCVFTCSVHPLDRYYINLRAATNRGHPDIVIKCANRTKIGNAFRYCESQTALGEETLTWSKIKASTKEGTSHVLDYKGDDDEIIVEFGDEDMDDDEETEDKDVAEVDPTADSDSEEKVEEEVEESGDEE